MQSNKNNPLGHQIASPETYAPDILFALTRNEKSNGRDIWIAHEVSWLNANGLPQYAPIRIQIPADSSHIIESKSLKLYLNSLNFKKFDNDKQVLNCIYQDLTARLSESIQIDWYNENQNLPTPKTIQDCDTLTTKAENFTYNYQPDLLETQGDSIDFFKMTPLFRSCCPVTGAPDWAKIYIYAEKSYLKLDSLLPYLISFRRHMGFHESCISQIFDDILNISKPEKLWVMGVFQARGGIAIWPIRHTPTMPNLFYSKQE